MKDVISAEVWWQAVRTLDNAAEYLLEDAGKRDISWTKELSQARDILFTHADKLRARAVKLEIQDHSEYENLDGRKAIS